MEYQLADLFESIVDRVPDRPALAAAVNRQPGTFESIVRRTYRELDERANQLAHYLHSVGIGAGDHVGCHLLNGVEYVETMIACFKISAVPVNVNYRYVEEELRYLYTNADLKGLVFDAELADRVAKVAPTVPTLKTLLAVGDQDIVDAVPYDKAVEGQSSGRDFASSASGAGRAGPRSADDVWLLYTGGTTGMPKGVMWRHEDVFFAGMGGGNPIAEPVSSPEELAQRIDPNNMQMTMMAAAPLIHGAAQLGTFISFWAGTRVVLIRRYHGPDVLSLIESEKVNTISIVGDAMAIPLIDAANAKTYDVSSLFVISTAGAIMSVTIRDQLKAVFPNAHILDSFGSSETGYGGMAAEGSSPDEGLRFRVTPRTAVITNDHRFVEPGSDEIGYVSQSGHIPLGYYNDEEKTAQTFVEIDGKRWVMTGDQAQVDADGIVHFLGRGSVCINSGGEKIFPEEVEAALKAHPAILDAVVTGVPDTRWGERVAAVIELREGQTAPTQSEIEEHLADRIARYKMPRTLKVVDKIVRSPAGKLDYRWAKQIASEAG